MIFPMKNLKISVDTYIPNLKFHTLAIDDNCSDFEVNSYGCYIAPAECVVWKSYQQWTFANA